MTVRSELLNKTWRNQYLLLFQWSVKKGVLQNLSLLLIASKIPLPIMGSVTLTIPVMASLGATTRKMIGSLMCGYNWSLIFRSAQVLHINFDVSNHLPILLNVILIQMDTSNVTNNSKSRTCSSMTLLQGCGCLSLDPSSHPDTMENLISQLENCSKELIKWNLDIFGHIGSEICKVNMIGTLPMDVLPLGRLENRGKRKKSFGGKGHAWITLSIEMPTPIAISSTLELI
ncbi:hypothetical protein Cgig2_012975 [Carnegiea gigantea]|uniref:Uncharacterized protein n=1 Tax=Carnegiea gigantea TaxID=171969 RepID=A0A9Q1K1T0_9CARY|nr:hypothetical protein Cgig2_012975 [Carnegiea gigantea]